MKFKLKEFQDVASKRIDKIFESKDFAGAVLPTGAGKSFLAIQQILQAAAENEELKRTNPEAPAKEIFYIAPTNEILQQVQRHIAKYVLDLDVDKMDYTEIQKSVKKAFPYAAFMCYQTLSADVDKSKMSKFNPGLIILDEAHRSGAAVWQDAVENLIKSNPESKTKVLAISATPERDVDGRNMMDEWALRLGYSKSEIEDGAHLGVEMTLTEAVKSGDVVEPEVIHFDSALARTDEYRQLVQLYKEAPEGSILRENLRKNLDIINNEIIKIPRFDLLSEEQQEEKIMEQNIKVFAQAVRDGKVNPNGKYILFIPHNTGESNYQAHYEKYQRMLQEILGEELGKDAEFLYLTSHQSDKTNSENLNKFSNFSTNPEAGDKKLKIIIASDKLNEGVHVEGISGSFMARNITEGNKNNKRAQAILFLQQVGRCIHGSNEDTERPVIFDVQGNFYKQNRNNPDREEFTEIDLFKLTDSQKRFVRLYNESIMQMPEKSGTVSKLPRLFATMDVLLKFGIKINNETVTNGTTLDSLIENSPQKDEIIQALQEQGLYSKRKYNIYKNLQEAKKSFWDKTKYFERYELSDLKRYGIIDTETKAGLDELRKYMDKYYINEETGFIQLGASEGFWGMNIYTGTELDPNGRDMDGFLPGQFDESGYDYEGYDRYGFDRSGIHRVTNTIHDEKGFMKDGTNILTGTHLDQLGYNRQEIREEYDGDEESKIVGGWNKNGLWYNVDENGRFVGPTGKYRDMPDGARIDVYGFYANSKRNYLNGDAEITDRGFFKNGENLHPFFEKGREYKYLDRYGYDRDGYDRDGFDASGIHRDTHTHLNPQGLKCGSKKLYIAAKIANTKPEILQQIFGLYTDGKFHMKTASGKEIVRSTNRYNFDRYGVNAITNDAEDIYGFTIEDALASGKRNEYGFKVRDIPRVVGGVEPQSFYRGSCSGFQSNILGTDRAGRMENGKKHPSLEITTRYIKQCMSKGIPEEEFIRELAISQKMLIPDAQTYLNVCINQAVVLYRVCPELARECQDIKSMFQHAEPEKIDKFIAKCPSLRGYLKQDIAKYIQELDKIKNDPNKSKKAYAIQKRVEEISQLPGFEER